MNVYLTLLVSLIMYIPVFSAQGVGHGDTQNTAQRSWIERHKKKAVIGSACVIGAVAAWQLRLRGELKKLVLSKIFSGTLFMNAQNNDHNHHSTSGLPSDDTAEDSSQKSRLQASIDRDPLETLIFDALEVPSNTVSEVSGCSSVTTYTINNNYPLRDKIFELLRGCKDSQNTLNELDTELKKSSSQLSIFIWQKLLDEIYLCEDVALFNVLNNHIPREDRALVHFLVQKHFAHYHEIEGNSHTDAFVDQLVALLDEGRLTFVSKQELDELRKSFNISHFIENSSDVDGAKNQQCIEKSSRGRMKDCDKLLYRVFERWKGKGNIDSKNEGKKLLLAYSIPKSVIPIIFGYLHYCDNQGLYDNFITAQKTVRKE